MGISRGNAIIGSADPDPVETNVQNSSDLLLGKGMVPNRWSVQDGCKHDWSVSGDTHAGSKLYSSASVMISCCNCCVFSDNGSRAISI